MQNIILQQKFPCYKKKEKKIPVIKSKLMIPYDLQIRDFKTLKYYWICIIFTTLMLRYQKLNPFTRICKLIFKVSTLK